MRFLAVSIALTLAATAPPAFGASASPADEAASAAPAAVPNPWVATALPLIGPALLVAGLAQSFPSGQFTTHGLLVVGAVLTPLTPGVGHFYAGDWNRGWKVTLGGPLSGLAGALGYLAVKPTLPVEYPCGAPPAGAPALATYALQSSGTQCAAGPNPGWLFGSLTLGLTTYSIWAAQDAHATALRMAAPPSPATAVDVSPAPVAAPSPAVTSASGPEPWLAALLTLAPAACLVLAVGPAGSNTPLFVVPASFGAGHLYAGDPGRALLVWSGGLLGATTGAAIGVGATLATNGSPALPIVCAVLGGAAFGIWATVDAADTARRARPSPAPSAP